MSFGSDRAGRVGLLFLCAFSVLLSLPYVQTLGDDTFIYMRTLDNFLDTGRLEYNVGEPCYIFTSVTWFLSWAGVSALLRDVDAARYFLSLCFHGFAFAMLARVGRRLIRRRVVLYIALATIFFDPFYLRWFWGGWEVSPKIAAAALTIAALLSVTRDSSRTKYFVVGLSAGLAVLTRPEMMFLALYGLIYLLLKFPRKASGAFVFVGGLLAVWLPWALFAYDYFGWAIPHTIFIKASSTVTSTSLLAGGIKLAKIVGVPLAAMLSLIGAAMFWVLQRPAGPTGAWASMNEYLGGGGDDRRWLDYLLVGTWGCTMLGYLVTGSPIASVYTSLFSPFLVLILGAAVDWAVHWRPAPWLNRRALVVFVGIALAVSVGVQSRIFYRFSYFNPDYRLGTDVNFVDFSLEVKELTEPGDTIGLWELGVIGYYTDRYIIDFAGLATPELVAYGRKYGKEYVEKFLEETGRYPDYLCKQIKFATETAYERSTVASEPTSLHERVYEPIHARKAHRVGGGRARGSVDLMILYRRR